MGMNSSTPAWRQHYPFASNYLELGSQHRYHYVDEGAGEPVVMVHGNPTWSFYYRRVISLVAASARAVVPDHLGCGLSDKPQDYEYRLQQHIDNLETLLNDKLNLSGITLIVHDWGGAIGMGYAVRNPERIRRIVVLNTAAFLLPQCPLRIRLCRLPLFGTLAVRGFNAFARAAIYMASANAGNMPAEVRAGYLAPYNNYRNRIATLRFVEDIPLGPRHPSWKVVSAIQKKLHLLEDKPMLICWGKQDFCFTEDFLAIWQQYYPAAHTHLFADAGHYVLEDAWDRIEPLLCEFIGLNSSRG